MIEKKDQDLIEQYTIDASNYKGNADIVYIPENSDEVIKILSNASHSNTPVTFSGAGTGLTGGRVANAGIVLSSEKFNKIVNVDIENKTITAQPAVLVGEISDMLDELGYMYPPNPTEKTSSIGGNVSTNASGSRTLKYGATRDYVQQLKIILSNGDRVSLSRSDEVFSGDYIEITSQSGRKYRVAKPTYKMPNLKHAAGYYSKSEMQAIDLFIGSEGTLGFIEEITLRFIEKPEKVIGIIVFFDNKDKVFDYVAALQANLVKFKNISYKDVIEPAPRLIEFFDSNSLKLLREKYNQIDESAIGAIWIEQEIAIENEDQILENWFNFISQYSNLIDDTWTALNDSEHEKFREFRHTLPEKVFEIITRNNQHKVGLDTAVPNPHLKKQYEIILEKVAKFKLDKVIYGHIGNNHLHANVFFRNEAERENAYFFYDEVIAEVLKLGGTVSAEHGIGKLKVKYLREMFGGSGINQMLNIKKIIDKAMILNIGNLIEIKE